MSERGDGGPSSRGGPSRSVRIVLPLIGAVLAMALALSPFARAVATTVVLLPDLFDAAGPRPLGMLSARPTREEIALTGAEADLYRPSGGLRHGAVVMTLGVHPIDKREPVVVSLADGLARAGLGVMVVQSRALMEDRIEPSEPSTLVEAFQRLSAEPWVDRRRVGLVGFSAGASLAFLAATDPRIAGDVRLVTWLGGFADARKLVTEVSTASYVDDGRRVAWTPHPLSRYVFRKQLVDGVTDTADRDTLESAFVAEFGAGDPAARERLDNLGTHGALLRRLFESDDPNEVDRLLADLPRDTLERLDALSPIHAVGAVRARVYVMVDRSDPLVPYVHSRLLARALPAGTLARYVEFEIFEHVQPTKPVPPLTFVRESGKLGLTVASILADLEPAGD